MRKSIEIHSTDEFSNKVDHFVDVIADEMHIGDDIAVVSMAARNAVEYAIMKADKSSDEVVGLALQECMGGVLISVELSHSPLAFDEPHQVPSEGDRAGECLFFLYHLADSIASDADGRGMKIDISLRDVELPFTSRRQAVLQKFYVSHPISMQVEK